MMPEDDRNLYSKCIREVIAPGFDELGISVGTMVEDYGEEWAALPPPPLQDEPPTEATTA